MHGCRCARGAPSPPGGEAACLLAARLDKGNMGLSGGPAQVILYNYPKHTGNPITAEAFGELKRHSSLIAVGCPTALAGPRQHRFAKVLHAGSGGEWLGRIQTLHYCTHKQCPQISSGHTG